LGVEAGSVEAGLPRQEAAVSAASVTASVAGISRRVLEQRSTAIVAVAQQQAAKIQRVRQTHDPVAAEHVVDLGGWFGRLAVVEYTCRVEVAEGDRALRWLPRTKGMPRVVDVTIAGMDNLDQRCLALLARNNRYPVTDATARARMLGEIEKI